jgi:hypothetical protein
MPWGMLMDVGSEYSVIVLFPQEARQATTMMRKQKDSTCLSLFIEPPKIPGHVLIVYPIRASESHAQASPSDGCVRESAIPYILSNKYSWPNMLEKLKRGSRYDCPS